MRENDTINEIHSDLHHVTIVQDLGGGVHVWLVTAYNVALFFTIALQYSVGK